MGLVLSWLGLSNASRTDDPDPATGLTSRDKYLIKNSWATVMKNPTDNGVALLLLYFQKFPEAKKVFVFKDVPNESLKNDFKFRTHCNSVVYAVTSMVDAVDNIDLLVSILEKTGTSHARKSVTPELFLQLKDTMLELFGSFMKIEEVEAWQKALEVIFAVIVKAVNEKFEKS